MRWAVLAALLLAGCSATDVPPGTTPPGAGAALSCGPCAQPWGEGGDAFEPDLAIDPADPQRLHVAQTPFGDSGRSLRLHSSADGGATWSVSSPMPPEALAQAGLAACTTFADPGVVVAGGDVWVVALGIGGVPGSPTESRAVLAARSVDGRAWEAPVAVWPPAPRPACTPWAGTGGALQPLPDMTRLATAPDGRVVLTWRHLDFAFRSDYGIAVSVLEGTWSPPALLQATGDEPCLEAFSGPQPGFARDGSLHVATLMYGQQGAEGLCVFRSADLKTAQATDLGPADLAWPRFADCGAPTWVAQRGGQVVLFRQGEDGWEAQPVAAFGEVDAATPSAGCIGDEVVVTAFAKEGFAAALVAGPLLLLDADVKGHGMGTAGMGHYMDVEPFPGGARAVWVGGEQGNREVRGAVLSL